MDDHRSRKRRRHDHDRQAEPTTGYAAADIGRDDSPPERRRGTEAAAAETRVRSHINVPENGYVYDWLAGVGAATEEQQQQAQTEAAAGKRYGN